MADQTAAVDAAAIAIYEALTPPEGNPEWEQVPDIVQHVFRETALAALEAAAPHQMEPGRYWRALDKDGEVWCETSDEEEVRASTTPERPYGGLVESNSPEWNAALEQHGPFRIQRHYVYPQADGEWRDVD